MAIGKVIGRVAIKVLPDTSEFREKTANDLRRIEKQLGNLEVDVIPELDKRAKEKLKAELKAWAKELAMTVKVDLDLNNRDMVETIAELEELTRKRKVRIAPELDNGAVAKVAAGLSAISGLGTTLAIFRNFRKELMELPRAVPKIAVVSHAIAGLGAWVLGASGNLFSLSSSLATIGQAGLALPGIFGGIAIGLGTTIAALKDFNKQVPQATRYVHQLQDTISQNFWKVAAGPIRDLVDNLFPILNRKLAQTSTALGGFFAAFANSAAEKLLPLLSPMFDSLTKSIEIATQYTDNFVGIIAKLGNLGASYLPSLAKWFGDISAQFDGFLAKAQADGSLKAWVDEGITSLKQLGSVTVSIVSIFHSIGKAAEAAGGSTLSSLSEGLKGIAAAAASPAFQSGLTDTLRAAYNMMNQIATIAGPAVEKFIVTMSERFQSLSPIIGDSIGTAIDAIASALSQPAVTKGLTAMFEGINSMVHSLAPAMAPLADKFAVMGELVGALAANIGSVMGALIQQAAPVFVGLVQALMPVINMLGPLMTKVINALGPVFAILGEKVAAAASALTPLFSAVKRLVDLLLPVLVPVLGIVVGILGDALIAVIQGVTWVFEGLVKIVSGVMDVFKGFGKILAGLFTLDFGKMWDGLKQVFSGLGSILLGALQAALGAVWAYMNGTVLGFFKKFAVKLLGPIAGPLGKFFKPLEEAATKVWGFLKKVWDKISNLFKGGGGGGGIKAALTKPFESAVAVIKTVFGVIKTVVETAWTVIKTIFGAAFKVISTIVKTYFTVMKTIIETYLGVWKTIITTAWNVIKTIFSAAFAVIKTIFTASFGAIRSFLQTTMDGLYFLFKGPWDAISNFLLTTITNIKVGFMLIWDSIRVWFDTLLNYWIVRIQTVWNGIKAATSAVWNAIKAIFTVVWGAIKTVVTTYINAVKSVVTTVWKAIRSATKSAWNAIEHVLKGAWNGIKSVVTTISNAVKAVISRVWSAIKSATSSTWNTIKSLLSGAWNAIKGLVSSAVGSVRSRVTGAWNTIKGATSSAWNSIKSVLSSAWSRIKQVVVGGVQDVIAKVKSIPGKARAALAGIGSVLINAGKALIQGLLDGIGSMIGKVKDKLKGLTDLIPDWKGPREKDKTLLTGAGRLIIDGLIRGFEDKFMAVRSMLTDLTREIAGFIGKSMSQQISDALTFAMTGNVGAAITAEASVQGVNLDRRLGGLERQITTTAKTKQEAKKDDKTSIQIDNITIPLEDLAQLKDLEEFLDMLRVRTRQG